MNSEDLGFLPATQLAEMIRTKHSRRSNTCAHCWTGSQRWSPRSTPSPSRRRPGHGRRPGSRSQADVRGDRIGRLHGVPVTIKDLADHQGYADPERQPDPRGHQPSEDAPMVTRLQGRRRHRPRQDHHLRVRLDRRVPLAADRHHPQPLEARLQRRRVLGRSRRRVGRRLRPVAPGQRRRRFDPHASAFLRRLRPEAVASAACPTTRQHR